MTLRSTLQEALDQRACPGDAFVKNDDGSVQCYACAHRCRLLPGKRGVCKVRFNREGKLFVPRNYVAGIAVDPVEKKPFFHVLPGSEALSFGMLGCNFRCDFCQNWISSQALKEGFEEAGDSIQDLSASALVDLALKKKCPLITSTYNEPLITSEWSAEIFDLAKEKGLVTSYVSNGFATPEILKALRPRLDVFKVDLKCFSESTYRRVIGGTLRAVMDSIVTAKELGYWVEVVTLVVPGMNDSDSELSDMAKFLSGISRDIPWHVTAFTPQFRMEDRQATEAESLRRGYDAGRAAGLRYVYTGNRPGLVGNTESTSCPKCRTLLIERNGFRTVKNRLNEGACPDCGQTIPGLWKNP